MAKKKILLLSDDLRLTSGIATVSRDIVLNTIKEFDWVQLGAAINHPDKGKIFDLSDDAAQITGVPDASSKIYAHDGYGDPLTLRRLIDMEKPDAILHFTDPRFWGWLYNMEHEIRQYIPLLYLNIWDGAGLIGNTATDPMWNKDAYASCDLLMAISKQTYGINNRIFNRIGESTSNGRITYVPHGINSNIFYPINANETEQHNDWNELQEESKKIRGENPNKFVVMWNNRNIHRKHPGDVVLAYKHFCQLVDKNGGNAAEDCVLFMHTQPIDPNGTDLVSLVGELCNEYTVLFDDRIIESRKLNILYNNADVVINMASNEGFGLATAESIISGTPVVVNVTGGLQDQCGFINPETNEYFTEDDYIKVHTLHRKDEWGHLQHGEWVKPVWPSNISVQGSVPTPYIFDDRADFRDIGQALYEWYQTSKEDRKIAGLKGRKYMMDEKVGMESKNMGKRIVESINNCLNNFNPRSRYGLYKV
jgi:glycosyltransferase involved in cell wall biosynthesis